jgi:hypothetical protein
MSLATEDKWRPLQNKCDMDFRVFMGYYYLLIFGEELIVNAFQ